MKTTFHSTGFQPAWRSGTHTPARQVVAHTGGIVRGKFPSAKAGRMVAFESLLERDALYLCDFSESVTGIREQPFTLPFTDGTRVRRYTPDFALKLEDGSTLVLEVKPVAKLTQPDLAQTFALIRNEMRATNQRFRILTDDAIRREPRLGNLKLLHRYLSTPLPEPVPHVLHRSCPNKTLEEWGQSLGGLPYALAAIAHSLLIFDWSQELCLSTPVFAPSQGDAHVQNFL
ncbi:TnsA endonuclease N-terminal domain-containing protein [Microvirgula aerodenitrificans]|uniref:TnsA endonuclease N-terminal domain-containing protein n=1 Tax=Microvirgula aerodenitrificans TaxID=57480 RepID=UPI00248E5EE2|nr:TnsA endonuclease N-terminal domain-containing protein [Microvirgula aerodenitrificans]